jgi:hypothetical protein
LDAIPGPLWLRLSHDGGRWFLSEFYLDGRGAEITPGMLRALSRIPPAVIGALIDGDDESAEFARMAAEPGPDLSRLASYALAPSLQRWAPRLVKHGQSGWALDSLRAQLPAALQEEMFGTVIEPAPAYPDPDHDRVPTSTQPAPAAPVAGRIDDEFLRSVAGYYRWAVGNRLRPGPEIARASKVSLRTAQNWVYLARKSGTLAPTKPGRVN